MAHDFQADITAIAAIRAVPTILDVVCRVTGMGFAAVARVTEERWIACAAKDDIGFGLKPGGELKIETTICNIVRANGQPVVIDHVAESLAYRAHPIPALYGFQSYISVPIFLPSGEFFGTLCAIDPKPARVESPEIIDMFRLFADMIGHHIETGRKLQRTQQALIEERKTAELREMFIAVLGHDLRNPLAAISSGLRLMGRTPLNERATMVATMMQQSVTRMNELITNVMDFARGRLVGGLELKRDSAAPLEPVLQHVINELRITWPGRVLVEQIELNEPVNCDRSRVAQMFSNLLSNALTYGPPDQPIRIAAATADGQFTLSVSNAGPPIPADALADLFEPFQRGHHKGNRRGLGLGLHIASEIARAHGGTLSATSSPEQTCFTFTTPLHPALAEPAPEISAMQALPPAAA
jgi:signal transduction histidine kinase